MVCSKEVWSEIFVEGEWWFWGVGRRVAIAEYGLFEMSFHAQEAWLNI